MDKRSWPWKKKSSEKATVTADSAAALSNSVGNQSEQDNANTINYVQIPLETYKHLNELEDKVKVLQEKISSAQTEMIDKENLVKQHAKVAEEAVSGWEKAEAEASALKNQLESVTLLKLTAEERALHLDGALKECMKQVRIVKEESEQKLHDVVFAKTKQWEKVKAELEAKLADFEHELLRASAENSAISRSLQERSNILMQISDEKTQAEAEIEILKSNIQSFERETSSLKYELHVVSKELEIRNEEKNMSVRSADVANKQHLEDVKKISKLEAECQRLRGLVRKKLPGPAALAQMKLEVENLGRDYGDTRLRRSPAKNSGFHHLATPSSDFALENMQQLQKVNEFLTARLLTMEEETKMLKEALTNRNSELQASRDLCAKATSKLRAMEAQGLAINHQKSPPKSSFDVTFGTTLIQNGSNPPSLTSMSEDGIDDEGSCSESWATALMSELSQFKTQKPTDQHSKTDNSNHLELMDDFLEMERLACLPRESNGSMSTSDALIDNIKSSNADAVSLVAQKDEVSKEQGVVSVIQGNLPYSTEKHSEGKSIPEKNNSRFISLKLRIASIFESQESDHDIGKILEDIKCIMQDTAEELPQHSISCIIEETNDSCDKKQCQNDMDEVRDVSSSLKPDGDTKHISDQELQNAISKIYDFVMSFGKKAAEVQDELSNSHRLLETIEKFSSVVKEVLSNKNYINTFILMLSQILSEVSEMRYSISNDKGIEGESNISDCIDKVTLLENKVTHESRQESFSGAASSLSRSSSNPEIEGPISENFEVKPAMQTFSLEEFEQMKMEKETMEMAFASCSELLEKTKVQLTETEQNLAGLKSQLVSSQKSNSLAETQLKCMAESYKLLEQRAQELEAEVNLLRMSIQTLNEELQEEKRIHQDDLEKYKDLQEQIERTQKYADADVDVKKKQEKEIAAAAEKLAECQETILLLGRQLQSLRPQAESPDFSPNHRFLVIDEFPDESPGPSGLTQGPNVPRHSTHTAIEVTDNFLTSRTGEDHPVNGYNSQISTSDIESPFPSSPVSSKRLKHRSSSGSITSAVSERQGRGFSRFFSKAKNDH